VYQQNLQIYLGQHLVHTAMHQLHIT